MSLPGHVFAAPDGLRGLDTAETVTASAAVALRKNERIALGEQRAAGSGQRAAGGSVVKKPHNTPAHVKLYNALRVRLSREVAA
jgi:hypothetical protein